MLVGEKNASGTALWWYRCAWLSLAVLVLCILSFAPYLTSSTELVRMRNALLLTDNSPLNAVWTPADVPPDYLQERGPIDPYFLDVAQRLGLAAMPSDWDRVLAISHHLLGSSPVLLGGAVKSDLRGTYQSIVTQGKGYCGDFVDVFMAIALAAGMPVRAWAFSFDGFGGDGHVWPEIWNRQLGRWQMVGIFNNYYFFEIPGVPLSSLEFRQALLTKSPLLKLAPLYAGARLGWSIEDKAWAYFRRGLPEWYMWWGNNVFAYDRALLVRTFSGYSRSLEQLGGIVQGISPPVRLMVTELNRDKADALWHLHIQLIVVAWVGPMAALASLFCWVVGARARRRQLTVMANPGTCLLPIVGLVGPLPPPAGGMANQCEQLIRLLRSEGVQVEVVRTNAPYYPTWVGRIPMLRAVFRLAPYLANLWVVAGRVDVIHILANSGWAWHLFTAPAMVVARLRETPVIVNYRGGNADPFFTQGPKYVLRMLAKAKLRVTPSVFLQRVFQKHGLDAHVIPNIVDLARFTPSLPRAFGDSPHIVVTRNLEPIYDMPTAIRAFAVIRKAFANARLTIAGSGPELANLHALVDQLQLGNCVRFAGRIDNASIPALYASADCMINPSTVDNMPISILEAFASGVPVVSTRVGGIPDVVAHGVSGLLVPVGEPDAMAQEVLRILQNPTIFSGLRQAGMAEADKYAWAEVRAKWLDAYVRSARPEKAQ